MLSSPIYNGITCSLQNQLRTFPFSKASNCIDFHSYTKFPKSLFAFERLDKMMSIKLPRFLQAKQMLRGSSVCRDIPKGYLALYVGEEQKKRFVIPVGYLNEPSFRDLLSRAEEEFGFNHPSGGLTIPCREDTFADLINHLSQSK